jgi:hypothetical protein
MKKHYLNILLVLFTTISFAQQPIITAIVDGDCSGGNPKLLEIYANGTVDFSLYSLENQTNANTGSWAGTFDLSGFGTVTDGFVYVTTTGSATALASEFPSIASSPQLTSGVINLNGDDRIRLIETATATVIDQYGVTDVRGTNETWNYADSFAKRVSGTGPDAGFTESNWTIGGTGTLDGLGTCQGGTDTFETLIGGIATYTATAVTTPTITVIGALTGLDYFENNGPSNEGSINVSGMNLTTGITATATDFELSLTSGGNFVGSLNIPQTGGAVANTPIYVRLKAGLTTASYTEDIIFTSGMAPQQTVNVSGTVSPDSPQITVGGSVDILNYFDGNGPSQEDSIGVAGRFLTSDIVVTATAPFEVSLTTGSGFGSSVNVPFGGGNVNFTDVFIRLAAGQLPGNYTGTLTVSSTNVTDQVLNTEGNVLPVANCAPVGSIIVTEIMNNPAVNNDPAGEYFELYNTTNNPIDIQSWEIKDEATATEVHTITSSLIIPANGYVVIGNAAIPNGGVVMGYTYGNDISLGNGTDGVVIDCAGTVIDEVTWDNGATFPDPSGASMELSITALNHIDNDLGSNWGTAVTPFGDGDLGTPGAVNNFTLSNESFENSTFSMYPNPVQDGMLYINSSNGTAVDVIIYSVLGQKMLSVKDLNSGLDISNIASGMYLVKITQANTTQTYKLVIK